MEITDKFIMWSDGVVTSIGIDASNTTLYSGSGKLLIKDPVAVIFSTGEEVDEATGERQARLNFEMVPYLFGALLEDGDNIWEIDARHVLQNHSISSALKNTYYNTVFATNRAKRTDDGEVEITPTK
jgi:hypothetical protein